MKRETVNRIRFVLEEILPPIIHDSRFMVFLYKLKWGKLIDDLANFRIRAPFLTDDEYRQIYINHPRIQHETDNSRATIDLVSQHVLRGSVCDVGCGTGHLLSEIRKARPELTEFTGVDFMLEEPQKSDTSMTFVEAPVEKLPFNDNAFDTVVCTHVLEHILDIEQAVEELRRITARRLIIVVPIEREHVYTFNPHFHFFPFPHSFLRVMRPDPERYSIQKVQRDIFYVEDMADSNTSTNQQEPKQ